MSLSRIPLPSISLVLEVNHSFIPQNPSAIRLDPPSANAPVSTLLMKTTDMLDRDVEDGEDERSSLVVGILEEPTSEKGAANSSLHSGHQSTSDASRKIKHRISIFMTTVRDLLSVKFADALLWKAVQH